MCVRFFTVSTFNCSHHTPMNAPDLTEPTAVQGGSRVVAHHSYRLRTLTVHNDALVVVLRGTKQLMSPTQTLTIPAGQAVMMAAGTTWDVVNDPNGHSRYEALLLTFEPEWVQATSGLDWPQPRHTIGHARVLHTDELLREAVQRTLGQAVSARLLQHRIQEVLLWLAERGWSYAPRHGRPWPDRVRQLVAQRPDADWSAPALAAVFHTSESTLRRRLEDAHLPLATLVRDTRLEVALGLLQTTSLSVGDVAQRCGWASHSRFSAAFQARWGVSPRLVRGPSTPAHTLADLAQTLTESG